MLAAALRRVSQKSALPSVGGLSRAPRLWAGLPCTGSDCTSQLAFAPARTASGTAGGEAAGASDTAGTIADIFVALGGQGYEMDERFAELKERVARDHGLTPAVARDAWGRLMEAFKEHDVTMAALATPQDIIPEISFDELAANGQFTEEQASAVREAGTVLIRGVVPEDTALGWKADVQQYSTHDGVLGFPADNPQVFELYWSQAQMAARQAESTYLVTTLLNRLWLPDEKLAAHDRAFDAHGLAYCDRLRIRDPGDAEFALGPHVDGGGIERWEDENYRKVYSKIFEGDWESFDAFAPEHRVNAKMDMYNTPNACTAFRSFQGWMALSHTAPGEGTLRVHPRVQLSTAYIMLRPFLEDVEATAFPGALPGTAQDVNEEWHPEICLQMVSVPRVAPGDCVFWHGDVVHAVEGKHGGTSDSSVFYIPAIPGCRINAEHTKKQRENFLKGMTPPDFPANHSEVAFSDRATEADLTPLGRKMMGLDPWLGADSDRLAEAGGPTTGAVLEECADILGVTSA